MIVAEKQINLFDVTLYGGKKLRGHYKEKVKKEEPENPYAKIARLYGQIANYLPIPIMQTQEQFDYEYITLWYGHYSCEYYDYQGEAFRGEDFKIIEAELKGTERFDINERIYLHEKLINLIRNGIKINEAAAMLQPLIFQIRSSKGITEQDYGET